MYLSSIHVIHAGQKYTISLPSGTGRGMSADYKSVFRLAISCTVLGWRYNKFPEISRFSRVVSTLCVTDHVMSFML